MSFRNTFITDFIYQAADDVVDANFAVTKVFKDNCTSVSHEVDKRGYGYYAGIIGTSNLDVNLSEMSLEHLVSNLERATKVPFRLTIMQESGAVVTFSVQPRGTK